MKPVELLTPPAAGAVAVIRIRGAQALARLERLLGRPLLPPARIGYTQLAIHGEWLDEALYVRLGELEAELHVTASPPLVQEVLTWLSLGQTSCETAKSLEEWAQEELPLAPCEAGARVLLDQAEGALRREFQALLLVPHRQVGARVEELLERGRWLDYALHPRRVVLLGPPNAGKSTLFNVLLGEERALVDESAGTTRDALNELAKLGEWPVDLVDTAGLRELAGQSAAQALEQLGQERSRWLAARADLCLWLTGPSHTPQPQLPTGCRAFRVLYSMADEHNSSALTPDHISALAWPDAARTRVGEVFRECFQLPPSPWEPRQGVPFRPEHNAVLRELQDPRRHPAALGQLRSLLAPLG